jgi:molecular chaperone HscB
MSAAKSEPENYFQVFGLPVRFQLDEGELQRKFYELSRENHPDRFAGKGAQALQASLTQMSRVNQAYSVLKDRRSRREHILALTGAASSSGARGSIPMELAENWFELQDALLEDPEGAVERAAEFRKELEDFESRREQQAQALERAFDQGDASSASKLAEIIREQSYLQSLKRDLDSKMRRT